MLLIALLATGSRRGPLALIVGLTVVWLFTPMKHKVVVTIGVSSLLFVIAVVLSLATGTASAERYRGAAGGESIIYRLGCTKMALMMIHDHPFVDIGTGNFPTTYNHYSPRIPEIPRSPYWAHNSFLQTRAENGVFAFVTYASVFLAAMVGMLRVIYRTADPALRRRAVLILAMVCGYFVLAGSSNALENENFWIAFALATVISYMVREEIARRSAPPGEGAAA